MKKILIFLFFIPFVTNAQNRGKNWAISDSILLTFNQSSISINESVLKATTCAPFENQECMASISDDTGQLLFSTNGFTIWNKNNEVMMNGDSLLCSFSITNGVEIIPYPNHDSLYFIFYIKKFLGPAYMGFSYSVVNMNYDGGLGAVTKKMLF